MKKHYVALNPETKESEIFNSFDESALLKLNNKGYNIYESINTFKGKRRTELDVGELISIWIDLDIGKDSKFWDVDDLLKYITDRIWILPTRINDTYKWYHIFFDFEDKLKFMSIDSYKEIYYSINNTLWWDYKMVSVTGVLKMIGFKDMKNWRNQFINRLYLDSNNVITEDWLNQKWFIIGYRDKEKEINKSTVKERNTLDMDNLDAKEIIEYINNQYLKNSYLFKKKIELREEKEDLLGVDDTSWLKLKREGDKWLFADYSKKNRSSLWKFLKNYYAEEKENEEVTKHRFGDITRNFGIKFGSWANKISVPHNFVIWIDKKEYLRKNEDVKYIEWKEEIQNIEELIRISNKTLVADGSLLKVIMGVLTGGIKNQEDEDEFLIWENDLLELFWKKIKNENKKNLRTLIIELSKLNKTRKVEQYINGDLFSWIELDRLFNVKFLTKVSEKGKIYYWIKFLFPYSKIIQLNKESLKLDSDIKDGRKFWFLTHIKLQIEYQKHKSCNLTFENLKKILNYNTTNDSFIRSSIKKILEELKEKTLVHWYEIEESSWIYTIW